MVNKTNVIIGINPGTRYIAVAVLAGTELRDWREKAFFGPWSEVKSKKILKTFASIIDLYHPRAVAFKRVHRSRSSPALECVISGLLKLSATEHRQPFTYTTAQLIGSLLRKGKADRVELIRALVSLYPSLQPLARREANLRRPYHWRLFDALGCALACSRTLEGQEGPFRVANRKNPAPHVDLGVVG